MRLDGGFGWLLLQVAAPSAPVPIRFCRLGHTQPCRA
jgi:hypothetical protein